jgi:hypothetical protein
MPVIRLIAIRKMKVVETGSTVENLEKYNTTQSCEVIGEKTRKHASSKYELLS